MGHRRKMLVVLGAGAFAWPAMVRAQAPVQIRRIGVLSTRPPSDTTHWHQALREGLRDRGWIEGNNLSIEYRYAGGRRGRLPALAADLVRLRVEVIVTSVTTDALVVQKATRTIPVVMAAANDPVTSGLVESLRHPGGNITGLSQMSPEVTGKRLEMLKEIVPALSRVAVLWNPRGNAATLTWQELRLPAQKLEIKLHSLEIGSPKEIDRALEDATRARAEALFILPDPVTGTNLKRIADLAVKNRLPSIFQFSEFADAGGLLTYGPDRADMYRRAASFVDKILRGAKPADLPVERPIKFELVVNLKTAKALGLTIPPEVMVRATRVIQ